MKIKCYAPWAGGKRTLAKVIIPLLGDHHHYFEPFVGGCAILPQKPISARETVNDMNPRLVNVLRQFREGGVRRWIQPIEYGRNTWEQAMAWLEANRFATPKSVESAIMQLIAWWMGPNGHAGTTTKGWFAQRHSDSGGSPETRWASFKGSVPTLSDRMANVEITRQDFREFFQRVPDEHGVAVYVDPPYFEKEFQYEVDFTWEDHEDLAGVLNRYRKARIVLSYRDMIESPLVGGGSLLAKLYPGWRRIEAEMVKAMASASGTAKRNTEVLLVNDLAA